MNNISDESKDNKVLIEFEKPYQVINMGGPWVGDLLVNGKRIIDCVLIDNVYRTNQQIYFIRYHEVSKWQAQNYFSANYFDLATKKLVMFDHKFEMIYLDNVTNSNILVYFEAFHNTDVSKKREIDLSKLTMIYVNE